MLDGEDTIVTKHTQRRDELLPPFCSVAITAGSEDPPAIAFVRVRLRVKNTCAGEVSRIKLCIFCVDVEDSVSQNAHGCNRVNVLPEHMTWIVIATNRW